MTASAVSALISDIRKNHKKYRRHPSQTPDKMIVEVSFINKFVSKSRLSITDEGIGDISISAYGRHVVCDCHGFSITNLDCLGARIGKPLRFYYTNGIGFYKGDNYGLVIQDQDDNILYWREAGQDPRTEWLINCLAGDLEDENGQFVFTGKPVTF